MKIKNIFLAICCLLISYSYANEEILERQNKIQSRIDSIGTDILNYNKIPKRIVFVYDEDKKKEALNFYENITKRQIVIYGDLYKSAQNDDELAAILAREISFLVKSYNGVWGGRIDSIQTMLGVKKFEIVADKRAVDYMVNAQYNPLALIVYLNKTYPQKRTDTVSRHNLTSKRLAYIYEYITLKYPEYLKDNKYIDDKYYQNFLLTSIKNRKMLESKIRTKSTEVLKYE